MNTALYISLLLFGSTLAVPTLYKERQDGGQNIKVDLDDISFLIIPPSKLIDDAVQIFGRHNTPQVQPAEGQSKQLDPQNSPYTVELSSSIAEEAKPSEEEIVRIPAKEINKKAEDEKKKEVHEPVKKVVEDAKKTVEKKKVDDGVKKTVEDSKKKVDDGVKKTVEDSKKKVEDSKKKNDDGKKKMKMDENEDDLTLIQTGIEECGPDGKRNSQGICIYTPINS